MSDGKPYFVMQFIKVRNLRSEIVVYPTGMDFKRIAKIAQEIGRALDYAHEKGICHRDLNPKNIMLQNPGQRRRENQAYRFRDCWKVSDSQIDSKTEKSMVAGTLALHGL